MSLATEVLLVSGVALDLVGAGVLAHAHNAESIVELREAIGEEGAAVGESDTLSTHAQLLAEKRIGFLLLTVGLVLYLSGVVLKSPEGRLGLRMGTHRGTDCDRRSADQPRRGSGRIASRFRGAGLRRGQRARRPRDAARAVHLAPAARSLLYPGTIQNR